MHDVIAIATAPLRVDSLYMQRTASSSSTSSEQTEADREREREREREDWRALRGRHIKVACIDCFSRHTRSSADADKPARRV